MTDDEFLSLVPGTIIYHRDVSGREATVETNAEPRTLRIFGRRKPSEFAVQIRINTGSRQLLHGGPPARSWCLRLEDITNGLSRIREERLRSQRSKEQAAAWIKRRALQQAERLAERRRAAGPTTITDSWVCLRFEKQYGMLSSEEARARIVALNFFDKKWNVTGRFAKEFVTRNSPITVIERRSGLMWQRGVDLPSVDESSCEEHVDRINSQRFAGFDDWRIPTLEEAATLLDPLSKESGLHLDPVFGSVHGDPEGKFLRATQSDDVVLSFISQCNERELGPSPPYWIMTVDAAPGYEPYEQRNWKVDFGEGNVTEYYDKARLLACRFMGVNE